MTDEHKYSNENEKNTQQGHAKPVVLVIDDESMWRRLLDVKFKAAGFQVIDAISGEEGIQLALREHPDAIIVDLIMPGIGGIQTAKKIREDAWGKQVPIFIHTGYTKQGDIEAAIEMGIFEYLLKDGHIEKVVDTVLQKIGTK